MCSTLAEAGLRQGFKLELRLSIQDFNFIDVEYVVPSWEHKKLYILLLYIGSQALSRRMKVAFQFSKTLCSLKYGTGFPVCSWDERREVHAISSPESPTIFEKTFTLKTGEYLRVRKGSFRCWIIVDVHLNLCPFHYVKMN